MTTHIRLWACKKHLKVCTRCSTTKYMCKLNDMFTELFKNQWNHWFLIDMRWFHTVWDDFKSSTNAQWLMFLGECSFSGTALTICQYWTSCAFNFQRSFLEKYSTAAINYIQKRRIVTDILTNDLQFLPEYKFEVASSSKVLFTRIRLRLILRNH